MLDTKARDRAHAYLKQARQYHGGIASLDPVAKPLLGYYFALNLAKAFLTVADPAVTAPAAVGHGVRQAYVPGIHYSFKREKFKIADGVFRLLAERTGMRHCWANNYELGLSELAPYLADGFSLFSDAHDETPDLLPVERVEVLFGGKEAWLRVEVDRNVLRQRNLSPERLLGAAAIFGNRFELVHSQRPTASYQSQVTWPYGQKRSEVLGDIRRAYDESLIACDRSYPGGRRYIVLSGRASLLSHESVTFGVLHHLSTMVRYRPQDAERLLGQRDAWILTSWVDRACESYLLNMASRITGEEHLIT